MAEVPEDTAEASMLREATAWAADQETLEVGIEVEETSTVKMISEKPKKEEPQASKEEASVGQATREVDTLEGQRESEVALVKRRTQDRDFKPSQP